MELLKYDTSRYYNIVSDNQYTYDVNNSIRRESHRFTKNSEHDIGIIRSALDDNIPMHEIVDDVLNIKDYNF